MTAIFVVAAIAVVGAVIARVTWRRPADERHSIQSHQQTLDTLRSMADRRPGASPPGHSATDDSSRGSRTRGGHVQKGPAQNGSSVPSPSRASGVRPAASARSSAGVRPPAPERQVAPERPSPVRTGDARSGPVRASSSSSGAVHQELVFVDDATSGDRGDATPRISPLIPGKALPRLGRIDRGNRRRGTLGRVVPLVTGVAVLGLVAGVAVALAPSHHGNPHAVGTSRTTTTGHATHHQTTPTTAAQEQPTSSTANTAAYTVPSTSYTVSLAATGLCWVQATEASTGNVVWTGTLQTGQNRAIPATGSLILRLGAANDVDVTVNGEPVVLPTGFQSPFDMRFAAA